MAGEYGKKPLWQWILIYVVIGAVVYGLIYYFVIAKKSGGYNYTGNSNPASSSTPAAVNSVMISGFSFSPETLTVKVGDTVTWTNNDSTGHDVVADDGSFDTGVLSKGQSGTNTFKKAGKYTYHCSIHPTMKGTVIVK